MLNRLKVFIILLIVPFLYSCQNLVEAQEKSPERKIAYVQVTSSEHTKHIHKQQRNIHKRLRKIKERMEKRKKHKGGK